MAPVAGGVQVAQRQLAGQPQLDPRHPVGDLAGDKLDAAQRAFVVEQDARAGMHPEALAVVHRHPMGIQLGRGVRAARIERRALGLLRLLDLAEHLRRRRLVEPRAGRHDPHRLQHIDRPHAGDVAGQDRLLPGRVHKALRRQVIDLHRLHPVDDTNDRRKVHQIAIMQRHPVQHPDPAQPLANDIRRGRPAQQPVHGVALVQQQLRQIGPILPGNAGNQRVGHGDDVLLLPGRRLDRQPHAVHLAARGLGLHPVDRVENFPRRALPGDRPE